MWPQTRLLPSWMHPTTRVCPCRWARWPSAAATACCPRTSRRAAAWIPVVSLPCGWRTPSACRPPRPPARTTSCRAAPCAGRRPTAGVLYPPRAAVEHRGGAYRNGTNCDIFTKPPHKDWIFEGALPSAWPAPWFCSEVIGIVQHTKGGKPRVVTSSAPAPTQTLDDTSAAHCLLDRYDKDDTYCFVFDAVDKASPATATADVTVIWALHNAVSTQMTFLLPSACFGSTPCHIQVHVEQQGAPPDASETPARICMESVRRQLQLPRIRAGRRVLWHAPAQTRTSRRRAAAARARARARARAKCRPPVLAAS